MSSPLPTFFQWTPSQLNGLILWLRASDEAGNDGDLLGTLTDQSGNGHHFTQATGANKPILEKSFLGGRSAYYFDGARIASCAAFTIGTTQQVTLYIVMQALSANNGILFERTTNYNSNSTGFLLTLDGGTPEKLNYAHKGAIGYSDFHSSVTIDTTTLHRVISRSDKSLAANEATMDYSDTTTGTWALNADNTDNFNDSQSLFIGARSGLNFPYNGYILELALTSTANRADEAQWKSYIASVYGI